MGDTYWGDPILEEKLRWVDPSYPQQQHTDVLADLPQSVSLLIELDLRGIEPPKFLPLLDTPPATLQVQKPETAQIFLCASFTDAKSIFQRRKMEASAGYIEQVTRDVRRFPYNNIPSTTEQFLMPYDPRCLLDWLSIQPGRVQKMLLPEYVAMPSKPHADQLVVRSQVHLTRGADNRYMAVWFDFRDAYTSDGKMVTTAHDNFAIPPSAWQRQFACRFQGLLNEPIRHAKDFPGFLLIDLLRTDIMVFEKFVSRDQELLPVATHAPVVVGYLEKRLDGFELTQSMIRKSEDIQRYINHMSTLQALESIASESRSSYEQSLRRLEIGSSLLVSNLRRRETLADKRLEVYNQFAQQRQASSLSALTYCAAFFLPLSLAGTFLSMQNRARDLRWIVYDFCGITTVFCTVAALVYLLSWAWSHLKTLHLNKRLEKGKTKITVIGQPRYSKFLFGVAWMLMVASFLVGMLHDLRLGLIMLTAPAAVVVLSGPGSLILSLIQALRTLSTKKTKEDIKEDLEAGGGEARDPSMA
ncbi:hypothetical protein CUC08_Gglean010080 [Alternaria sp. MG1]|nr:hypothetical protein CUC08_Gglean010080 [Alternaria sp. MG1]